MYVIKVENRIAIDHPVDYENFLLAFPSCPRQETPTNNVIGPYGYEVFIYTPEPTPGRYENPHTPGPYTCDNDIWTNTWITNSMTSQEIEKVNEIKWWEIRTQRNGYLRLSDWTQLPDAQITEIDLQSWRQYRQQLRDLTFTTTNPFDVVFPTPPYPFPKPYIPGIVTVP